MTVLGNQNLPARLRGHPGWPETFNALSFAQFNPDGAIELYFQHEVPAHLKTGNIRFSIKSSTILIPVNAVQSVASSPSDPDAHLLVTLNPPITARESLDEYEIQLVESNPDGTPGTKPLKGFDPRRSMADLSTSAAALPDNAPDEPLGPPEINYLAKDFPTFKQLMLDRLSVTLPHWTEQNPSDLMQTLVELLAYAADYLSYFQDSVGTEAFLNTARRRISVRRLARLIDYTMHEGCNARTWVCIEIDQDKAELNPGFCLIAGHENASSSDSPIMGPAQFQRLQSTMASYLVYEPICKSKLTLYQDHNTIRIHTFSDQITTLPKGSTSAYLVDCREAPSIDEIDPPDRVLKLKVGDVLILEEVISPITLQPDDKDILHRHAVRITGIRNELDKVTNTPILSVTWNSDDALPFPLTLTVPADHPGAEPTHDITLVRGNVILVDHGQTIKNENLNPPPVQWYQPPGPSDASDPVAVSLPSLFSTVTLSKTPLTYSQPLPGAAANLSATVALNQDERQALPCITLMQNDGDPPIPIQWIPQPDLLRSEADDAHFVVEINDDTQPCLRFGDGTNGRQPDPIQPITATYRVGNGIVGNVGAERINCLVFPDIAPPAIKIHQVRNPLPAVGGTEPEPIDEVRVYAPSAFQQVLERAVTPRDYVSLAESIPGVQNAAAAIQWMGTREIIKIAIDPLDTDAPDDKFLSSIKKNLERYRLIGQQIHVDPATYVPIELDVTIQLDSAADALHLKSQLQQILGNTQLPNGQLGFFHPDNFTFGQPVNVNRIVTACKIKGVKNVTVLTLQRLNDPTSNAAKRGDLFMDRHEIAQLDYDPRNPLRGILAVHFSPTGRQQP